MTKNSFIFQPGFLLDVQGKQVHFSTTSDNAAKLFCCWKAFHKYLSVIYNAKWNSHCPL